MQARQRAQPSATNSPSSSSQQAGTSAFRDHFDAALCDRQGGAVPPGRGRFCPREHPPRARPWRRGSPDPIPNSEVKPAIAESTAAPGCGRIGRRARGGCFCFLQAPGPCRPGGLLRVGGGVYSFVNRFLVVRSADPNMLAQNLGGSGQRLQRAGPESTGEHPA